MISKINEPIECLIHFTKKGPIPIYFTYKNKGYKVENVDFVHTSFEGNDFLVHFAVSTQKASYKLEFNSQKLTFYLREIYSDGFIRDKSLNESQKNEYLMANQRVFK